MHQKHPHSQIHLYRETISPFMTGCMSGIGMTITSRFLKLKLSVTSKIFLTMPSSLLRERFRVTWPKRGMSRMTQGWHLPHQHCLQNELILSHGWMLKKPYGCGCSTWNRSRKLSQGQYLRAWVQNATKYNQITYSMTRYNLKEYRRHGEAASVNLKAVKREWVRVAKRLEKYPLKDRLNTDESGLFGL